MKIFNPELKERLIIGLPDSRITKVAAKVTVLSDKGSELVIKNRGLTIEGKPITISKPLNYNELDDFINNIRGKELVITSNVYREKDIRESLSRI